MTKKLLAAALALSAAFYAPDAARAQTGSDAGRVAKIKKEVLRHGSGEKSRVRVEMRDGRRLRGFIFKAGEDDFVLTDSVTGENVVLVYEEVSRVKGPGLSLSTKVLIVLGVLGAVGMAMNGGG